MAANSPSPEADNGFDPRVGELVTVFPGLARLTAPNASPYTHTGTNTFLVGHETLAVVDPGPDDDRHLMAILSASAGRRIEAIVLTHTHLDHCALAPRLKAVTGAPLVFGGRHRLSRPLKAFERNPFAHASDFSLVPDREIADGERLVFGGVPLVAVATPGHCANHFAFALDNTDSVLVGDHLMAWNTTVVAVPDGSLADYLTSLDRLEALPQTRYLPAHGSEIADGRARARAVRAHRQMRNGQILGALEQSPLNLGQLAKRVYPDVPPRVRAGARRTLLSHLEYLEATGRIRSSFGVFGTRYSLAL
ncbi:MBL fold metallo-hydrolase [Pelagibacterium limicola]|uniref:MBL fold metallo-hydrolase n=1 Tax=Pelagibacterium limicola TaxID=2791022 RepID=UPI0018B00C02|nr:MBL fold metallo-hydrolase [Pelagibacterium limicola]